MPFNRPTLTEINERVENQAKGLFGITVLLRRSFLSVISKVIAGVAHVWHGHLDYIARQIIPTQMDGENLDRFGSLFNLKRLSARKGQFTVRFGNLTNFEIAILASSVFVDQRTGNKRFIFLDQGMNYRIPANDFIIEEVVSIGIGKDLGSLDLSELLIPETSVAGLGTPSVENIRTQAIDDETTEEFRVRVLNKLRSPNLCGVVADYITWAREFSTIYTRVYVLPRNPRLGSVTVVPFIDTPTDVGGIQTTAAAISLENFLKTKVPVTATPLVRDATFYNLTLEIKLRPNTSEVQERVTSNVLDFIQRNGDFRGATNPETGELYTGELIKSKLEETISLTEGVVDHFIEKIGFTGDLTHFFEARTSTSEPILPPLIFAAFSMGIITYEDFQ